jgi:hypothetical protein
VTTSEHLRAWLRDELGLMEFRRVVREGDSAIVISKFENGFSQRLFTTVDAIAELFDDGVIAREYAELASAYMATEQSPLRTRVWREASEGLLRRIGAERGVSEDEMRHVLPGIESVQVVLDTILWTTPRIGQEYSPSEGELEAYAEFAKDESGRLFTRYYGEFGGKRVENYCPGSQFARRLVAQAWAICTAATI